MTTPKMKYRCDGCKYKFSRNYKPNLCPFCGREGIQEDTPTNAADILRDVQEVGEPLRKLR
ncbi:hypothetical protein HY642_05015 [Candidatus Woesearchaeota archaeon]|nr:hypothetical protein [Candidatus Woesearchaeota archaeon]